jgi:hypothetical protein
MRIRKDDQVVRGLEFLKSNVRLHWKTDCALQIFECWGYGSSPKCPNLTDSEKALALSLIIRFYSVEKMVVLQALAYGARRIFPGSVDVSNRQQS